MYFIFFTLQVNIKRVILNFFNNYRRYLVSVLVLFELKKKMLTYVKARCLTIAREKKPDK